MSVKRIALIGAGDLAQQIIHYVHTDSDHKVVGYFDDTKAVGEMVSGIPVLGGTDAIDASFRKGDFDTFLVAIGYRHMTFRASVWLQISNNIPMHTFVHSSCWVDQTAIINAGSIIFPGCLIDKGVRIGPNVLLNVGCTIAHDSQVFANCFLSPRVAIAGFSTIGENSILGTNCTVIDNLNIHKGSRLGAGAVLVQNTTEPGTYVGVPAKKTTS